MGEYLEHTAFLYAFITGEGYQKRVRASMVRPGNLKPLHLMFEILGKPECRESGFFQKTLSPDDLDIFLLSYEPFDSELGQDSDLLFLKEAQVRKSSVEFVLIHKECENAAKKNQYLTLRTTLLFDAFNDGSLRGSDPIARQALLDTFSLLPNRFLDSDGFFAETERTESTSFRETLSIAKGDPNARYSAIDKFPSLMSVRGARLREDNNRLVPSVMIRDGVHVGKRNIFMFHAAVNIAAYIGDDNMIDSHASLASSAQIGNRNKIGSFVSLEGVLSPANAEPVFIGDDNFIGTFVRIGTGIKIGNKNFLAAGVNLSLGTKIRDCRAGKGSEYTTPRELNESFHHLAIVSNNATRRFNDVDVVPGEYLVFENTESFMDRFTGDDRIKAKP